VSQRMAPPREIEVKLEVPTSELGRLTRGPFMQAAASASHRSTELVSVYFDTPKQTLRKRGLSLRVRHVDGSFVQTVKQNRRQNTGLFVRGEWESRIAGNEPDLDAARGTALEPLIGRKLRRRLRPMFETSVRRQSYPLASGDSEIEITFDRGKIKAADRSAPLSEVELELKQGDAADLFAMARALAKEGSARLGIASKAERGYALIDGGKPRAATASPIDLAPDIDQQAAFQIIARSCLHQAVANEAALHGDTAEAVHEMRVAIRRLRAAISLFGQMLAGRQVEAIKAKLKWIAKALGPARELDVFVERVVKRVEADEPTNGAAWVSVNRDVHSRRRGAFSRAEDAVASARYRDIVLDTLEWIEAGDWTRNNDDFARALRERPVAIGAAEELRRRFRKIRRQGARLAGLDRQRRHKLRIKVKKLRYAADFFATVFSGKKSARRRKKFLTKLKEMQDALGDLNDILVHEGLSKSIVDAGGRTGKPRNRRLDVAFAAGRLSGREEERFSAVMRDAERTYKAFAKAKPFWSV
jgi:triphosphatase